MNIVLFNVFSISDPIRYQFRCVTISYNKFYCSLMRKDLCQFNYPPKNPFYCASEVFKRSSQI